MVPVRFSSFSIVVLVAGCASQAPAVSVPASPPAASASSTAEGATSSVPAPAPPAPPASVAARWIVHEEIGNASRWLLVAGTVRRGAEDDPPADADYVILRSVDESFARSAGLPVRTLTIPRRYILPEPFTITLHVGSEPPGARIYEVTEGGALVSLGKAPVDVTYAGSVSDLKVNLLGATWLTRDVGASGVAVNLWAATDTMTSAPGTQPTSVPLLSGGDLEALRHGTKKLTKRFSLAVHTPIQATSRLAVTQAVVVNLSFFSGDR